MKKQETPAKKTNENSLKKLLLILCFFLFSGLSFSQFLPVRTYFTDDGLASSQVWSIVEDKKGYIWFGCSSGISKFNGFKFKNFRLKEGLPSESINKLAVSRTGFVIALTVKGIAYLEPNGSVYHTIPEIGEVSDITVVDTIIDYGRKNNYPLIIASVKGKGILKYEIKGKKWSEIGFKKYNPTALIFSGNKLIFSTSDGKTYQTELSGKSVTLISKTKPIFKIKKSGKNKLLLISKHSVYLLKNRLTKKIFETENSEEIVFDATLDSGENLWIATNIGLRKKTDEECFRYTSKNGIPGIRVLSTFQSSEGILWFGTNHGVCKLVSEDMLVYKESAETNASSYICFYYDKKSKTMMIGITSGILMVNKDKIKNISSPYIKKFPVWDIEKDKKGNLLIGTEGGGLVKLKPNGKENHYKFENGYLPGNNVTDILTVKDTTYIACKEGFSVYQNGKWKKYDISNGLPVSYVRCLQKYKNEKILLGTLGGGILIFKNGKFEPLIKNQPKELKSVYSLYFDKNNNILWAATNYGLAKIIDNNIKFYDSKNGFLPFGLSAVFPVKNYLWIGSDGGAQLFDPKKEKVIKILTKDDGLPGNEFTTHNAIAKDPENNIWFGLFGGAAKIEKLGLKINSKNEFKPKIFPVSVKYFYKNLTITNVNFNNNEIVIPFGAREIFITFDVIWFRNEYTLNLEYKLEGINTVWNKINEFKNMKIYYTSIKPGNHPLFIKASSISTNKTVIKKVLDIITPTPWWQKKEFQAIFIVFIIGFIYFLITFYAKYKTRKLEKEKRKLDLLVKERTEQLAVLNNELQKKNEILKELAEHDFLTGMYNRRFLIHAMEIHRKAATREEKTGGCFILFDIDFFKKINDTHGHDAGDIVLQKVSEIILSSVRESDIAVRYGGEEFLIVLTKLPKEKITENAFNIAEKIRKKIEQLKISHQGEKIQVTVSGGVCCFDLKEMTKEKLYDKLKEVDDKLYQAKKEGRNRIIM